MRVLHQQAKPVCDDCLVPLAGLSRRQVANQLCAELGRQGTIGRSQGPCSWCGKGKIVNWVLVATATAQHVSTAGIRAADPPLIGTASRPWYWEGHVQAAGVSWLVSEGFAIRSVADTAARTPGKDIIAVDAAGRELWVSVKGYPDASRNTQARHWFAGAVFDLVLYRNESAEPQLALALPDGFTTYLALSRRMAALRAAMPFTIYWVAESGAVRSE